MANVAASVDQRLRNLAGKDHRSIDDVRTRYVRERFLYRLSLSPYRNDYVLKGAVVLQTLAESDYRQTRDVGLPITCASGTMQSPLPAKGMPGARGRPERPPAHEVREEPKG